MAHLIDSILYTRNDGRLPPPGVIQEMCRYRSNLPCKFIRRIKIILYNKRNHGICERARVNLRIQQKTVNPSYVRKVEPGDARGAAEYFIGSVRGKKGTGLTERGRKGKNYSALQNLSLNPSAPKALSVYFQTITALYPGIVCYIVIQFRKF